MDTFGYDLDMVRTGLKWVPVVEFHLAMDQRSKNVKEVGVFS